MGPESSIHSQEGGEFLEKIFLSGSTGPETLIQEGDFFAHLEKIFLSGPTDPESSIYSQEGRGDFLSKFSF